MIAPQLHLNSEYITTGFAREGVEAQRYARRSANSAFTATPTTEGQGEGIGFGYHQQVETRVRDPSTETVW